MNTLILVTAVLLTTVVLSFINRRFLKLPEAIGILILALTLSGILLLLQRFFPVGMSTVIGSIKTIDFHHVVMDLMLGFLLFAGSYHLRSAHLKKEALSIAVMAVAGTLISTLLVGFILYGILTITGLHFTLLNCLLLGAIISPTDPVAVLRILTKAGISRSLETRLVGESLFNDGIAIVLFIVLLKVSESGMTPGVWTDAALLFAREVCGGLLMGVLFGYAGVLLNRLAPHFVAVIFITIILAWGAYATAGWLDCSGPLAAIIAGIITGNNVPQNARGKTGNFWGWVDDRLNALLFMLIGLMAVQVYAGWRLIPLALLMVFLVLLIRWVSVFLSGLMTGTIPKKGPTLLLSWGGLRGGLSLAMAMAVPGALHGKELLTITFVIVLFSLILQGSTVGRLAQKLKLTHRHDD